jgi:hypothetical protein
MNQSTVLEQLKKLSNPERLAVIEAATRLIREELAREGESGEQREHRLRAAALAVRDLYDPGGALRECGL